jgi:iron complex outermembrane receptor protein
MKKQLLAPLLACAQAAVVSPVWAQSTASGERDDETIFGEIVVTAERRNTDLQRTPIAASVLTGDDVANAGVTTVDQLQFISPGAVVNNFGQGIDFNIRGIGKAEHNTQTTTGVITYRDGVATFPGYFTAEPYYDIARVEILRGPQGTFVGQNATGGAVFVTSNDPVINGGHTGYVQAQATNYNGFGAQGAINLPMSDTFAMRLAFNADKRDSFYDIDGPATGDDGLQTASVRVGMLWEPSANFSLNFKADYNYLDLSGYPADPVNATNDPFELSQNGDQHGLDRFGRAVLRMDYEFANGTNLRWVSGYQQGRTEYRTDLDGTDVGTLRFEDAVDETIFSQEINLISPDTGRFKWVLGAYYQEDEYEFPQGTFNIIIPTGVYTLWGTNPKTAWAAFGQVGLELGGGVELQLGARYSDSKTTNHIDVNQYGTPITQEQSASFTNTSGKAAINWQVNDHHFLYAFVATGHRPGGLNVPVGLGLPEPFDEEKVTNHELGWKAGWADGRLRTQFNVFYNDYENFQVTVGYPDIPVFGFELNNPNATEIYGVEAQVEAVFGNFSMDAGTAWMQSSLGQFFATDPRAPAFGACDPVTGPASATCIDLEGNDQTYAPDFTFNLGMQYKFTVGEGDTLTPRVNYGHVSEQWATLFQNEARGDRVEKRDIVNAQLAWTHGKVITTLFGTNLTNQHYVGAINSGLRFMGPPRQFGIRVGTTF